MIPTYNCAEYMRHALESVLAQDPGPEVMQIEVVDDASNRDRPWEVVRELGRGRVRYHRQPSNVGHVRNFNTCLERSRGRLVHLLHGDDGVRLGFYERMQRAFEVEPNIGMAFCRSVFIDEEGRWTHFSNLERRSAGVLEGWLEWIAVGNLAQPPSIVVARRIYEELGGFDDRIRCYGEDWEMSTRIAAHHPVWFEPEPLALYRIGSQSLSAGAWRTGENVRDLRRVVAINAELFPSPTAERISRRALRNIAGSTLRRARRLMGTGDLRTPMVQAREALVCSHSPVVVARALRLFAALVRRGPKEGLRTTWDVLRADNDRPLPR